MPRGDDLARAVDVLRLEARRGGGNQPFAIDAVLVERSGLRTRLDALEPAVGAFHRQEFAVELQVDPLRPGRPQAKAHAARRDFCAEGIQGFRFLGHQRSSSSAAQSLPPMPKASASASTMPARTIRKVWRTMSPPISTWSRAIRTTKVTIAYCPSRPSRSASCSCSFFA